jgi:predicted transcriptional regulator
MSNVITARVSDETLAMIDRLAASHQRSRAWIVARLVDRSTQKEIELLDFIQVGLDDIAAGRVHSQQEVEAWFTAKVAARTNQIAAE